MDALFKIGLPSRQVASLPFQYISAITHGSRNVNNKWTLRYTKTTLTEHVHKTMGTVRSIHLFQYPVRSKLRHLTSCMLAELCFSMRNTSLKLLLLRDFESLHKVVRATKTFRIKLKKQRQKSMTTLIFIPALYPETVRKFVGKYRKLQSFASFQCLRQSNY